MKKHPSARAESAILWTASGTVAGLVLSAVGYARAGGPLSVAAILVFAASVHALGRAGCDEGSDRFLD